jgi:hypothetical protein
MPATKALGRFQGTRATGLLDHPTTRKRPNGDRLRLNRASSTSDSFQYCPCWLPPATPRAAIAFQISDIRSELTAATPETVHNEAGVSRWHRAHVVLQYLVLSRTFETYPTRFKVADFPMCGSQFNIHWRSSEIL